MPSAGMSKFGSRKDCDVKTESGMRSTPIVLDEVVNTTGALDNVLQLPDVARPVILLEQPEGIRRDLQSALRVLLAVLLEEMLGEQRDVLPPLAEGWQIDRDDVQTIVQILPEPVLFDHALQVDVGRHDDPHINFEGFDTAQAHELPFLDHA